MVVSDQDIEKIYFILQQHEFHFLIIIIYYSCKEKGGNILNYQLWVCQICYSSRYDQNVNTQ